MFKQIIQKQILNFLQDYVQDFDNEFTLDLLGNRGEMKISELHIKEDALKALQLPLRLKSGWVSSLHILIPLDWKRHPVQISMEELFVVTGPIASANFDNKLRIEGQQQDLPPNLTLTLTPSPYPYRHPIPRYHLTLIIL